MEDYRAILDGVIAEREVPTPQDFEGEACNSQPHWGLCTLRLLSRVERTMLCSTMSD